MGDFLMLAHVFDEEKHSIGGWYMSEKLDGMRAYWDGVGIREEYPEWADRSKHGRFVVAPRCTGLWSRYRQPIQAPDWWIEQLPKAIALDGELYMGRGQFQKVMSVCRSMDGDWKGVEYRVFDMPKKDKTFRSVCANLSGQGVWSPCDQRVLPLGQTEALKVIDDALSRVVSQGGEGLMLRNPESVWMPTRSWNLLKVKPVKFGVATVVATTEGKGKYVGMIGALEVVWEGRTFKLSGMTDLERRTLKVGVSVNFKYRELTDSGIPKEARYVR